MTFIGREEIGALYRRIERLERLQDVQIDIEGSREELGKRWDAEIGSRKVPITKVVEQIAQKLGVVYREPTREAIIIPEANSEKRK